MLLISVIVPVYNAEKTLKRCVDSILAQTFTDFELLLVDDGSKDKSGAMCDEYAKVDSRIKAFHKNNGGVSSARNIGLDCAIGEWICFVDSDDYISESFLPEKMDSSVDMYVVNRLPFGDAESLGERLIPAQTVSATGVKSFFSEYLIDGVFRGCGGKILKRSIIEDNKIRFDTRFKIGEDTLFNQQYYGHVKAVRVMGEGLYCFYYEEGGDERKYKQPIFDSLLYLEEFWRIYKRNNFNCKPLLDFVINYFKHLSSSDFLSKQNTWKWKTNASVLSINYKRGSYCGLYGKSKYLILRAMSLVLRCLSI